MLLTRVFPKSKIKRSVFCCLTNFIIRRGDENPNQNLFIFAFIYEYILYTRCSVLFGCELRLALSANKVRQDRHTENIFYENLMSTNF